ncbi:hypothetical protein ScPMuIL_001301 [Solemya velum]
METKVAPTYATLVMGYIEEQLYSKLKESSSDENVILFIQENWKRFLDDCFWIKSMKELKNFHVILNSINPSIQSTMEYSRMIKTRTMSSSKGDRKGSAHSAAHSDRHPSAHSSAKHGSCKDNKDTKHGADDNVAFMEFKDAKGHVYVIIRFNREDLLTVRNSCALQKKVIENYGGTIVGLAERVTIYEGKRWPQHPEKSLLVFEFSTEKGARLWLASDPKFKQQDWPHVWDNIDILILPMNYIPTAGTKSFMLTEIRELRDCNFQCNYVASTATLLDKMNIQHGVVASSECECKRGNWVNRKSYVLLHRAHMPMQIDQFYYSGEYIGCLFKSKVELEIVIDRTA